MARSYVWVSAAASLFVLVGLCRYHADPASAQEAARSLEASVFNFFKGILPGDDGRGSLATVLCKSLRPLLLNFGCCQLLGDGDLGTANEEPPQGTAASASEFLILPEGSQQTLELFRKLHETWHFLLGYLRQQLSTW
jgi:hypothetical protein